VASRRAGAPRLRRRSAGPRGPAPGPAAVLRRADPRHRGSWAPARRSRGRTDRRHTVTGDALTTVGDPRLPLALLAAVVANRQQVMGVDTWRHPGPHGRRLAQLARLNRLGPSEFEGRVVAAVAGRDDPRPDAGGRDDTAATPPRRATPAPEAPTAPQTAPAGPCQRPWSRSGAAYAGRVPRRPGSCLAGLSRPAGWSWELPPAGSAGWGSLPRPAGVSSGRLDPLARRARSLGPLRSRLA
jgi:hypothetical protein